MKKDNIQFTLIDKFHYLVNDLLNLNMLNRKAFESTRLTISPVAWVRQFCTVRIDIGRRVGKTEYINEYSQKDDIIIVPNNRSIALYKQPAIVFTVEDILTKNVVASLYNPEMIWIDDCCLRSFSEYEKIIENFVRPKMNQTFVIFGE